jgi:hypothetical protein
MVCPASVVSPSCHMLIQPEPTTMQGTLCWPANPIEEPSIGPCLLLVAHSTFQQLAMITASHGLDVTRRKNIARLGSQQEAQWAKRGQLHTQTKKISQLQSLTLRLPARVCVRLASAEPAATAASVITTTGEGCSCGPTAAGSSTAAISACCCCCCCRV